MSMGNNKALKRTLMDVRKMRRDVKMRKETDPEVVSQTLETILKEAVALSSTDDGAMSKAALKELSQVRRALVAQQVDAGANTTKFIGAYSAVLDNAESVTQEVSNQSKEQRDEVMSSFQDSLPSSETIISSIMTANPIFGYGLKMTRDLVSGAKKHQKNARERSKKENEMRLERLKEQERLIDEQFSTNDMQKENAEAQQKEHKGRRKGIYADALEGIRDEIKVLTEYLNGQTDSLEQVSRETSESSESLERITENDQKMIELEREKTEGAGLRRQEKSFEREKTEGAGLRRQEKSFESGGDSGLDIDGVPKAEVDTEASDFGLAGLLGGLSGGIAGIAATLLTPFKSMFTFLKSGGKLLMKFGKFGLVFAALKGIYDFIDGVFNASEILGREDVDWKDRVKVGIGNVLSGLLEPINWITEKIFGVDLIGGKSRDEMTRKYFDFFDNFTENVFGMAKWIFNIITDKISEIAESLTGFIKDLTPDWVKDLVSDKELTPEEKQAEEARDDLTRLRQGGTVSKPEMKPEKEQPKPISSEAAARAADAMDKNSAESVQGGGNGGGNLNTFAPVSSNKYMNSHQYVGNSSSENREPTARRFSQMNSFFSYGN